MAELIAIVATAFATACFTIAAMGRRSPRKRSAAPLQHRLATARGVVPLPARSGIIIHAKAARQNAIVSYAPLMLPMEPVWGMDDTSDDATRRSTTEHDHSLDWIGEVDHAAEIAMLVELTLEDLDAPTGVRALRRTTDITLA